MFKSLMPDPEDAAAKLVRSLTTTAGRGREQEADQNPCGDLHLPSVWVSPRVTDDIWDHVCDWLVMPAHVATPRCRRYGLRDGTWRMKCSVCTGRIDTCTCVEAWDVDVRGNNSRTLSAKSQTRHAVE